MPGRRNAVCPFLLCSQVSLEPVLYISSSVVENMQNWPLAPDSFYCYSSSAFIGSIGIEVSSLKCCDENVIAEVLSKVCRSREAGRRWATILVE